MPTRDQQPYAEHADTTAAGVQLFSLHNLTAEDVAQVQEAIRSRRLVQAIRLDDQQPPPQQVATRLRNDAARLDLITVALNTARHAPAALDRQAS